MKYGVLFLLLGALFGYAAVRLTGAGWLLLWPAISFTLVALGYLGVGARVFGKRNDGGYDPVRATILAPFLLYARLQYCALRIVRREPRWNEVAQRLYVGRWPRRGELPAGVAVIVDMTAELPARATAEVRYLCLPTLDGYVPEFTRFARLVDEVATIEEPVYVHCAEGHGRSGMFATAVVLRRGFAGTVDDAITSLRVARPGIRLARAQRALVRRWQERDVSGGGVARRR